MGRPFWAVWSAGVVSFAGDGVLGGALPLLTVALTTDPRVVALVDATLMVGWLTLGLVSGVVVDRVDRLRLMAGVDAARVVATAGFAGLVVTGRATVPVILGWALLNGLAAPFFDNAQGSVIPELVEREQIERANSLGQSSMLLTTALIGPPLGATLFVADAAVPFVVDAVSFGLSALVLWRVAAHRRALRAPAAGSGVRAIAPPTDTGVAAMLREGAAYLRAHPTLRTLALAVGAVNAVIGGVTALFVLYVVQDLGLPERAYGFLLSVFAVGGLGASFAAPALVRRFGPRACALGALVSFSTVVVGLGLVRALPAVVPLLLAGGASGVVWDVTTISYRQRVVPAALLGRVTAVYRTIAFLGVPLGAVLLGQLAHAWDTPRAYLAGGLGLLVVAGWAMRRIGAMDLGEGAAAD